VNAILALYRGPILLCIEGGTTATSGTTAAIATCICAVCANVLCAQLCAVFVPFFRSQSSARLGTHFPPCSHSKL
jgi:hypothetical protein